MAPGAGPMELSSACNMLLSVIPPSIVAPPPTFDPSIADAVDWASHPDFTITQHLNQVLLSIPVDHPPLRPLYQCLDSYGRDLATNSFPNILWGQEQQALAIALRGIMNIQSIFNVFGMKFSKGDPRPHIPGVIAWLRENPSLAGIVGPRNTYLIYEASRQQVDNCNLDVLRCLVEECGCSVNQVNTHLHAGPAHIATWEKNWVIIDYLAQMGCDFNVRNDEGEVPLNYPWMDNIPPEFPLLAAKMAEQKREQARNAGAAVAGAGGGAAAAAAAAAGGAGVGSGGGGSGAHFADQTNAMEYKEDGVWKRLSAEGSRLAMEAIFLGNKSISIELPPAHGFFQLVLDDRMRILHPDTREFPLRPRGMPPPYFKASFQVQSTSTGVWDDIGPSATKAIQNAITHGGRVGKEIHIDVRGMPATVVLDSLIVNYSGRPSEDLRWTPAASKPMHFDVGQPSADIMIGLDPHGHGVDDDDGGVVGFGGDVQQQVPMVDVAVTDAAQAVQDVVVDWQAPVAPVAPQPLPIEQELQPQPAPPPPPVPPPQPVVTQALLPLPPHESLRLYLSECMEDIRDLMASVDGITRPRLSVVRQPPPQHSPGAGPRYVLSVHGSHVQVEVVRREALRWTRTSRSAQESISRVDALLWQIDKDFITSLKAVRVQTSLWEMTRTLWHQFVSELRTKRKEAISAAKARVSKAVDVHLSRTWALGASAPDWIAVVSRMLQETATALSRGSAEIEAFCTSVRQRVCDVFGKGMAGFNMADASKDPMAPVVYMTDGLLRQQLLYDSAAEKLPYRVVILDEVHERSLNIDITIALLARALEHNEHLRVVLCSATLDPAVTLPFTTVLQRLGQGVVGELQSDVRKLHSVTAHSRPRASPMEVVLELLPGLGADERLLCFLPSEADVKKNTEVFQELTKLRAFALFAQQPHNIQQRCLERGSVFFSTNIAETSLTLPNLRYVVDSGVSSRPRFDPQTGLSHLEQVAASKSTLQQRKGRLGRTMPGDYYGLYDEAAPREEHPPPQSAVVDLLDIDLDLRRAPDHLSLAELIRLRLLPSPPQAAALTSVTNRMREVGIVDGSGNLSDRGRRLVKLPCVGNLNLCVALLSALEERKCGNDLVKVCSIFRNMTNSTSSMLGKMPGAFKSADGDVDSLLKLFNAALLARGTHGAGFDVFRWAKDRSVEAAGSLLNRSLKHYEDLRKIFTESTDLPPQWKSQALRNGSGWEPICRALLDGYRHHTFVSLEILGGNKAYYVRADGSTADGPQWRGAPQAALAHTSTMTTKHISESAVPFLLCFSMLYTPRMPNRLLISLANRVDPEWVRQFEVERKLEVTAGEGAAATGMAGLPSGVRVAHAGGVLTITGPVGPAAAAEVRLLAHFRKEVTWTLEPKQESEGQKQNLKDLMAVGHVFHPMIFRWKNTRQVQIERKQKVFTIKGREREVDAVQRDLGTFQYWFDMCAVLHTAEGGVEPAQAKTLTPAMQKRIALVAKPDRSVVDLYQATRGPEATRETRMCVVAWLAVNQFKARLEGGFVRDYIIGGPDRVKRPPDSVPKSEWYTGATDPKLPHKDLIPPDLDLQLDYSYFDLEKFKSELARHDITVDHVWQDSFRAVIIFDANAPTGPFMADVIEPHLVATHDMIDFDVSNLYIAAGKDRELGMRIRLEAGGGHRPTIPLHETVSNIIANTCYQMRSAGGSLNPQDRMQQRVQKMIDRGWNVVNDETRYFLPGRGSNFGAVFVKEPRTTKDYLALRDLVVGTLHGTVDEVWRINAYNQSKLYDAMREEIAFETGGVVNERSLFHGTDDGAVQSIMNHGFDDRYQSSSFFGLGFYFADNIAKSHAYTSPGPTGLRTVFLCRVILGRQYRMVEPEELSDKKLSQVGFHSLFYEVPANPVKLRFNEYIVHRYGQAIPYMCVRYRV